jgi:5-formyltetrahydrofolate cyclo-ligase
VSEENPPGFSDEEIDGLRRSAKEQLRKRFAGLRRTLSAESRKQRSEAICTALAEHEAFKNANIVAGYAALRFEADPAPVLDRAFAAGKTVALPRASLQTGSLALHQVTPESELTESAFSVREPHEDAPEVALDQVDLVIVPGLAFDARGHRLGYGKGFYDRLLPRLPKAVRVGFAFELSLLVEVPATAHDAQVHWIFTDRRVIRCSG